MKFPYAGRCSALTTTMRLGLAALALSAWPLRAAAQVDIDCNKPTLADPDDAMETAFLDATRPGMLPRLPPSRWGDHPAVTVQRLARGAGYNYSAAHYPHPAWLWLRSHPVDGPAGQDAFAAAPAFPAKPALAPP